MRVLVISDTHIPTVAEKLPSIIEKEARNSDCCVHAGDFVSFSLFEEISQWTTLYAVCGNMDDSKLQARLPKKRILELEGIKLALTHGRGASLGLLDYISFQFLEEKEIIDIFVFGHSHMPLNEKRQGKIYFNPGSPTDKMFVSYNSYGILEIEDRKIEGRVVRIG